MVVAWTLSDDPSDSYLECNGQSVDKDKYPKLYALMHAVPDYTGVFLRGLGGNSADLGELQDNAVIDFVGGSFKADSLGGSGTSGAFSATLTNEYYENDSYKSQLRYTYKYTLSLENAGIPTADEIRPINKAVRYFIKAK